LSRIAERQSLLSLGEIRGELYFYSDDGHFHFSVWQEIYSDYSPSVITRYCGHFQIHRDMEFRLLDSIVEQVLFANWNAGQGLRLI
jgi:hypothetical protein